MLVQVVTLGIQELQVIIADSYKEGYLKASREWDAEKAAKKEEPKFNELLRGVKELRHYLIYKNYWSGSISTLSKIAPQLVDEEDKEGYRLIFRCGCIDHAFKNGFRFKSPDKKCKKAKEPIIV
jgi:hypothetical protein